MVLSAWNYFEENLLLGKSKSFGVEPWYCYIIQTFLQAIPPFSLAPILGTMIYQFMFRKSITTWVVLPFLLVHFLIGHKEARFLYPILFLTPYMMIKVI